MRLWFGMILLFGCTHTADVPEVNEPNEYETLFECRPHDNEVTNVIDSLKISRYIADDQPHDRDALFISIGDGVAVRSFCGQKERKQRDPVFACWYSGGGLTVYWSGIEPQKDELVEVDRNRLFGLIDNALHRLKCHRAAELSDYFKLSAGVTSPTGE